MGFKERYALRRLKKLAGKQKHNPIFPRLNRAKSVGVLWQPSQKEAYQYLKEYFRKEQVIFRGFCVFEESTNPHPGSNTLTVNDLTWWGLPKPDKTEEFTNQKFDILFNIAPVQNMAMDYLTILSNAKFKVGTSSSDENHFDLNIKIGEKDETLYLVKQQIFYLAQLNNKTST